MQARIQRIIAERFLPLLDDVFVAHRTHILRTTAYTGGPACIAGVLGSKSIDLGASGQQAFLPCCQPSLNALLFGCAAAGFPFAARITKYLLHLVRPLLD